MGGGGRLGSEIVVGVVVCRISWIGKGKRLRGDRY